MRRVLLRIAYDGTNYCGWQIQPNGVTIEEVLNRELSALTGESITVIGASRTDSGVHALGNVAVFDTETTIPPEQIAYALTRRLPRDIVILSSREVGPEWHPRYQPCVKTYEYHIYNRKLPNPLKRLTTYHVSYPLDVEAMRQAAGCLLGEHDFASFCNIRTNAKSTVRTIYELELLEEGEELVVRIAGNGFLYHMVRIIVGTLIRVGRGFYTPAQVQAILEARNRQVAGVTAPPQGLVLVGIAYREGEEKISV